MSKILALILVASVVVLAQPPPTPRGPLPPAPPTAPATYAWAPTSTITARELAQLMPLLTPTPAGRLQVVTGDALGPGPGRRGTTAAVRTCPGQTPLFELSPADTTRLGAAVMKHLKACTP